MKQDVQLMKKIASCTLHLMNGTIDEQSLYDLEKLLENNPLALEYYMEIIWTHVGLNAMEGISCLKEVDSPLDESLWKQLAQEEKNASAIEMPKKKLQQKPVQKTVSLPKEKQKVSRFNIFMLINAAAVIIFFLYLSVTPTRPYGLEVATLTDSMNAKWADIEDSMQSGTRLHTGRPPLFLKKGLVELVFDNNAKVTIEGPAEFQIQAENRLGLNYGKVFTKIPKEAIGFSIYTQSAKIIDLGTEFGVNVDGQGKTKVHLYKGKASLVPVSAKQTSGSQILHQGQAMRVDAAGDVETIKFNQNNFIRSFNSKSQILWSGENLNLAYVASGGDGFHQKAPNKGIDQATGRLVSGNTEHRTNKVVHRYMPVPKLPYVDGVFVPDGGEGPVQLTSAGHVFEGFDDTGGDYFFPIGAYSHVNMKHADITGFKYTKINLADYSEKDFINLCLHANSGITFDLQKIRQSMPFVKITGFSSIYGVPVTREDIGDVHVDFYVFVDGAARMIEKNMHNQGPPGQVNIPLTQEDRFLTLACTEGSANLGDWSLFVNPELKLESAE